MEGKHNEIRYIDADGLYSGFCNFLTKEGYKYTREWEDNSWKLTITKQ